MDDCPLWALTQNWKVVFICLVACISGQRGILRTDKYVLEEPLSGQETLLTLKPREWKLPVPLTACRGSVVA